MFKQERPLAPHCDRFAPQNQPLRYAICSLLLCCGLRLGEALNLKVGDIDFDRNVLVLRVTKKYKQRLVPFVESLSDIIYRYCAAMGISGDSEAYLFPTINPDVHLQC